MDAPRGKGKQYEQFVIFPTRRLHAASAIQPLCRYKIKISHGNDLAYHRIVFGVHASFGCVQSFSLFGRGADLRGVRSKTFQGVDAFSLCTILVVILPAIFTCAQENYEIRVYGSDLVEPRHAMRELHSNFTIDGTRTAADGRYSTNHVQHETIEITHGFNDWFECGFYIGYQRQQYSPDTTLPPEWRRSEVTSSMQAPGDTARSGADSCNQLR
jgi:hypothetical protein